MSFIDCPDCDNRLILCVLQHLKQGGYFNGSTNLENYYTKQQIDELVEQAIEDLVADAPWEGNTSNPLPDPYIYPFTNVQGLSIAQVTHQIPFVRDVRILDQTFTQMSGQVSINPTTQLVIISFTRPFTGMAIIY